jgi:FAD-dependent urate hydroxylase
VEIDEAIAPGNQWTTFVGEGKRVSLMPVSDGRFYFFFDVPLPAGLAEDRSTLRADLSRYFSGWAPQVQKLIAALDPQTTNRIEIHDIEPFERLVRGKVALLGDAGHSTTPDIGQGAARRWRMRWCWGICSARAGYRRGIAPVRSAALRPGPRPGAEGA